MSEFSSRVERLEPGSDLGSLILGGVQRQSELIGNPLADPELLRIHGGTHNATVLVRDSSTTLTVMCRRPLRDIRPGTSLYREREVHQMLPEGVSPRSYALDTDNPDRPIHILEYIEGKTLPYDAWTKATSLSLATKLARAHIPLDPQPTDLSEYLMRYNFATRVDAIHSPHNVQLSRHVLSATQNVAARAQSLFDQPQTVLAHHDLQASNIITDPGGEVWLWDWEYGGPLHPDLELGALYYPGQGLHDAGSHPDEQPQSAINPYSIASEMLGLSEEQERAFVAAYESVAGTSPARLERIRASQCINMARIVLALTAKTEDYPVGNTPEQLVAERDRLYDAWSNIHETITS